MPTMIAAQLRLLASTWQRSERGGSSRKSSLMEPSNGENAKVVPVVLKSVPMRGDRARDVRRACARRAAARGAAACVCLGGAPGASQELARNS